MIILVRVMMNPELVPETVDKMPHTHLHLGQFLLLRGGTKPENIKGTYKDMRKTPYS